MDAFLKVILKGIFKNLPLTFPLVEGNRIGIKNVF